MCIMASEKKKILLRGFFLARSHEKGKGIRETLFPRGISTNFVSVVSPSSATDGRVTPHQYENKIQYNIACMD